MAKKPKLSLFDQLSPEVIELAEAGERIDRSLPDAERFNDVIDKLAELAALDDPKKRMLGKLFWTPQLYVAACRVIHGGKDPKEVPMHDMLYCLSVTEPYAGNADVQLAYRQRIKGPLTAIRAKCMSCMNGHRGYIAECASTNCANWPFRMATNPFFGRIPDGDAASNVEAEEAEDAAGEEATKKVKCPGSLQTSATESTTCPTISASETGSDTAPNG